MTDNVERYICNLCPNKFYFVCNKKVNEPYYNRNGQVLCPTCSKSLIETKIYAYDSNESWERSNKNKSFYQIQKLLNKVKELKREHKEIRLELDKLKKYTLYDV
jgi:uncharacterized Zn finger protein (UPF0148 family)